MKQSQWSCYSIMKCLMPPSSIHEKVLIYCVLCNSCTSPLFALHRCFQFLVSLFSIRHPKTKALWHIHVNQFGLLCVPTIYGACTNWCCMWLYRTFPRLLIELSRRVCVSLVYALNCGAEKPRAATHISLWTVFLSSNTKIIIIIIVILLPLSFGEGCKLRKQCFFI